MTEYEIEIVMNALAGTPTCKFRSNGAPIPK